MSLKKYDISDQYLRDNCYYEEDISTKSGAFKLNIFDANTQKMVGSVEGITGTWRIVGDAHYEAYNLKDAIKTAISNYISYRQELEQLVQSFGLTLKKNESKKMLVE